MEGLLYRYLVRRTSGAEDREVYAWLEASEKNRSLFFEVAAVWSAHRTLISPATGERCDAMLRRLNARIDADDAMQRPARFAWRRWMSAAAAAAVVVIAVAAAWLAGLRLPEAGRFQSYANHTGDVAVLHLEDGTQVWLQDGTELRYAVGKGDGERIVRLDGEAYFDVSHDARHPFVVETRELAIRVLGTAFNVRRSPATRSRRWCSNAAPYASKPPAATTSCGCIPTSAPCTTPGWATWRWPKSTRRSM